MAATHKGSEDLLCVRRERREALIAFAGSEVNARKARLDSELVIAPPETD